MSSVRRALSLLSICLLAACAADRAVAPPTFAISDGARGGNAHFFFLPPMVRKPKYSGVFDGSLSPVVRITEAGRVIVEIPAVAHIGDRLYKATWHTRRFSLDASKPYRIRVLVGGVELGYADVDVVEGRRQLRNVNTGEFIPLQDDRTLPIKFRIEQGAIAPANLIAFQSGRTGAPEIFSIQPDGSAETQLTTGGGVTPDLSPDKTTIAFVRGANIWLMNVDGSNQHQIASLPGSTYTSSPRWSPDGSLVAFWMETGSTNLTAEIYVMRADGSGLRQLTSNSLVDIHPLWTPDGRVTWTRDRESIRAIQPDGTGEVVLVPMQPCGPGSGGYASFSPDGSKILYEGEASCGGHVRIVFNRSPVQGSYPFNLYVMNSDGSNPVPITSTEASVVGAWLQYLLEWPAGCSSPELTAKSAI